MPGLTAASGFVLFSRIAPPWLAFMAVASLLWYGFARAESGRVTKLGVQLVMWATPVTAFLLRYLHPMLDAITSFVDRHRPVTFHSGIYEREDLIELLEDQKHQSGSRISDDELDLAVHALSFGDRAVEDVMVARKAVKMVAESDVIGPILMGELHASGHSRFPVYSGKKDNITGTLYLSDLIEAKHGGLVKDVMHPKVYFVHEDHALYQVLHAFLRTKHHLFVVVNSFEEFAGIITIEDVIEQVIGHPIAYEFDRYDDMRAVASHSSHKEPEPEIVPETLTEVVE